MPISKTLATAMNEQVGKELYTSNLYLAMAAHFDAADLPGFSHWLQLQSDEERSHALKLFGYVLERGGRVMLGGVDAPPASFGDVASVVQQVADHEAQVTAAINAIYEIAVQHKDYAAQAFLDWFVIEQVEEEKQANDLLGRLKLIAAHGGSLLMIDAELARRE